MKKYKISTNVKAFRFVPQKSNIFNVNFTEFVDENVNL